MLTVGVGALLLGLSVGIGLGIWIASEVDDLVVEGNKKRRG